MLINKDADKSANDFIRNETKKFYPREGEGDILECVLQNKTKIEIDGGKYSVEELSSYLTVE